MQLVLYNEVIQKEYPLKNPSLTPIDLGFSNRKARIEATLGPYMVNGDYFAVLFWDQANRLNAERKPAVEILQHILPSLSGYIYHEGDISFDGAQYVSRDIMVLSSFMQWTGANIGRSFMSETSIGQKSGGVNEFLNKYQEFNKRGRLIGILIHEHTIECGHVSGGIGHCVSTPKLATVRDKLVMQALMMWLGTDSGRDYMNKYDEYFKAEYAKTRPEYLKAI